MPHSSQRVATVNVPPNRMSLVAKYESQCLINFVKVLMWVNAHQRAGGTVLFAGVCLTPRSVRIQPGAFAEIAFDCHHVICFGNLRGWRRSCDSEHLPQPGEEAGRQRRG